MTQLYRVVSLIFYFFYFFIFIIFIFLLFFYFFIFYFYYYFYFLFFIFYFLFYFLVSLIGCCLVVNFRVQVTTNQRLHISLQSYVISMEFFGSNLRHLSRAEEELSAGDAGLLRTKLRLLDQTCGRLVSKETVVLRRCASETLR